MEYVKLGSTGLEVSEDLPRLYELGEPERGNHPWSSARTPRGYSFVVLSRRASTSSTPQCVLRWQQRRDRWPGAR